MIRTIRLPARREIRQSGLRPLSVQSCHSTAMPASATIADAVRMAAARRSGVLLPVS
jgi:hypothetical protein